MSKNEESNKENLPNDEAEAGLSSSTLSAVSSTGTKRGRPKKQKGRNMTQKWTVEKVHDNISTTNITVEGEQSMPTIANIECPVAGPSTRPIISLPVPTQSKSQNIQITPRRSQRSKSTIAATSSATVHKPFSQNAPTQRRSTRLQGTPLTPKFPVAQDIDERPRTPMESPVYSSRSSQSGDLNTENLPNVEPEKGYSSSAASTISNTGSKMGRPKKQKGKKKTLNWTNRKTHSYTSTINNAVEGEQSKAAIGNIECPIAGPSTRPDITLPMPTPSNSQDIRDTPRQSQRLRETVAATSPPTVHGSVSQDTPTPHHPKRLQRTPLPAKFPSAQDESTSQRRLTRSQTRNTSTTAAIPEEGFQSTDQDIEVSIHNETNHIEVEHVMNENVPVNSVNENNIAVEEVVNTDDPVEDIIDNVQGIDNMSIENVPNAMVEEEMRERRRTHRDLIAQEEYQGTEHSLGDLNQECEHCHAVYFPGERNSNGKYTDCCAEGRVVLERPEYPVQLQPFFNPDNRLYGDFFSNIRKYNSSFAFASQAVNLALPEGFGPYCYRIFGEVRYNLSHINRVHHNPAFINLYFVDTADANEQRQGTFDHQLNAETLTVLDRFFRTHNPFAIGLRHMREAVEEAEERGEEIRNIRLAFNQVRYRDSRTYDLPDEHGDICMVFNSLDGRPPFERSLWVSVRDDQRGGFIPLDFLSPNVDPMLYPILFPLGEPGWSEHIRLDRARGGRQRVTHKDFYCYLLHFRPNRFNQILRAGKLTQQFIVDCYVKIEGNRLHYLRENQARLRAEAYNGLMDYFGIEDIQNVVPGRLFILPSTFIGSPRFYRQNYLDAMAIVTKYGKPDLFITFTCNPRWREICGNTQGLTSNFRPDLCARVFNVKAAALLEDITKNHIFGEASAFVYVIEFQKRGLPHMHLLVFLARDDKIINSEQIDAFIRAEIPDRETDEELYQLVSEYMLHGPCSQRCLRDGSCSKHFPKPFRNVTAFSEGGYPVYRRRDDGRTIEVRRSVFSNRDVVPYNPYLLRKYRAHINVEICSSLRSVKYLFKYIFKGHDRSSIQLGIQNRQPRVQPPNVHTQPTPEEPQSSQHIPPTQIRTPPVSSNTAPPQNNPPTASNVEAQVHPTQNEVQYDEIEMFLNARYISAPEAMWHILGNKMFDKSHVVFRLPVHLEREQQIYFVEGSEREAVQRHHERNTMLTAWFVLNRESREARTYFYQEIPVHFVFEDNVASARYIWKPRQRFTKPVIVRMMMVKPSAGERYYLRILLLHVRGAMSYEDLRTFNGVLHPSFREAAVARNLLRDDIEFDRTLEEAAQVQSPKEMRRVFALLLIFCQVENPLRLWESFKGQMIEDFTRRFRTGDGIEEGQIRQRAENAALFHINSILFHHNINLADLGFPPIEQVPRGDLIDDNDMQTNQNQVVSGRRLNQEQQNVFDTVVDCLQNEAIEGRYFYIDGPGGSGKTFLYNTLLDYARGRRMPCIAMASTGLAATLLQGGRTVHSHFRFPIPILDNSTSSIIPASEDGEFIRSTKLIVWDEIAACSVHLFNAVDRTLRDITRDSRPFGGKCVVVGGDFRQCAPIVPGGSRGDVINQAVKSSDLWRHFQTFRLLSNMRVDANEQQFKEWLLQVGNADEQICTEQSPGSGVYEIILPTRICTNSLLFDIFGASIDPAGEASRKNVILCPTNVDVHVLNDGILSKLIGESTVYFSADSVVNVDHDIEDEDIFPQEFLHSLIPSGMPPHTLRLKRGAIIILLRNIAPTEGLCNGTRLIVQNLRNHLIVAETLDGNNSRVLIPRIDMDSTDPSIPFVLRRRQFPVTLAWAMTINKAQGQTFAKVGVYLKKKVFSHGQLYVAFSRVRSFDNVRVQVHGSPDEPNTADPPPVIVTHNVVFKDLLN